MPNLTSTISTVIEVPAANPDDAVRHFEGLLALETDCWDVHESLTNGRVVFVCRNELKAKEAIASIQYESPGSSVDFAFLDLLAQFSSEFSLGIE